MRQQGALRRWIVPCFSWALAVSTASGQEVVTVTGLKRPESAAVGPDGRIYVSVIGEFDTKGDGSIVTVERSGKITPFATGLDDPKGIVFVGDSLFVADVTKVLRVDSKGKVETFAEAKAFPRPPLFLNDVAADRFGNLFVSDSGNRAGKQGAVFRITTRGGVTLALDGELCSPQITVPNGVLVDDDGHLFVADFGLGNLYRYDLNLGTPQPITGGLGGADGIARDARGRLFIGDWKNGRVFGIYSELEPPRLISDKFRSAADLCLTPDGKYLLVPDMNAGTLTWLPVP